MELLIISGRSGSGKSISLHMLEDLGYYCIDNLPASLLPNLVEHVKNSYQKIAIGIDARNLPADLDQFHDTINSVRKSGMKLHVIYLDAEDNTLLKRFSETRRKHPLSTQTVSLQEAIFLEKKCLEPVAHMADLLIDTTMLTLHQLRELVSQRVCRHNKPLSLMIQSFGFKYGVPPDSDFVFDVRFLPNPYWQQELRPYTGRDTVVQEFIRQKPETEIYLQTLCDFVTTWTPQFEASNRSYLTISVGCTGGQHRSVFMVEQLKTRLNLESVDIQLRHRELI